MIFTKGSFHLKSGYKKIWFSEQMVLTINQDSQKKSRIHETLTLSTCADNSTVSKKLNKTFRSNLEHLPVFKALCGAIRNRTPGQSTSPIRNTSLFLRLHAGTIHESNPEHLVVFKARPGDNPGVQSGITPCF